MSYTNQINTILSKIGVGIPGGREYEYEYLDSVDQARDQLVLLGPAAIDDMLSVFMTARFGWQGAIIRALVKMGDAQAIAPLEALLQNADVSKDNKDRIKRELSLLKPRS